MMTVKEILKWNTKASTLATMKERKVAKKRGFNDAKMILVSCHFPSVVRENMDDLVKAELFPNRSEFIRFAVMNTLRDFHCRESPSPGEEK